MKTSLNSKYGKNHKDNCFRYQSRFNIGIHNIMDERYQALVIPGIRSDVGSICKHISKQRVGLLHNLRHFIEIFSISTHTKYFWSIFQFSSLLIFAWNLSVSFSANINYSDAPNLQSVWTILLNQLWCSQWF